MNVRFARAAVTCALTFSALASGAEHLDFHVESRPNQPRHQTRFRQESRCRGLVMKYFPICITLRSLSPEIDYLGGCVVRSGPSMFACQSELSETRRLWDLCASVLHDRKVNCAGVPVFRGRGVLRESSV